MSALHAKAARLLERMKQTPHGPKRVRLASQYVAARTEAAMMDHPKFVALVAALRGILAAETHSLHVGYDNGSGGGNFVYADVVRLDDDAFAAARLILSTLTGA